MAELVKLTESDKEFIRDYVADVENEDVKKQRRKECAEEYGVSLPTISAVTAWTKIRANKTALESRPIEIVSEPEDNAEGCHANYDNPTKQIWREKWKNFLATKTELHDRRTMKVLCLPGKKCLEIPLYLELGFDPKNITGVEGGDENAKMEFHHHAYRYGIVSKLGRLENLLQHDTNIYDVVSLDFTGPLSKTCLDIVRMVPIAPAGNCQFNTKSYFMINLLAKRESVKDQLCLDFYASFTRPELMEMYKSPGMDLERFQSIFGYVNELADKAVSGEQMYEEAALKDKRNIGLVFLISSLIAKDRRYHESVWASYKLNEISLEARHEIDFAKYAGTTLTALLGGLTFFVSKKLLDILTIAAPQIVETVSNYRPFVYGIEQYQYISPVNNASSPFITEMYQLMTPMADYIKLRYFVRFFIDAIFWQGLNPNNRIYLDIRNKHGQFCKPGNGLHHKDSIAFVAEDGFVISTITWQRITDACTTFMSHIQNDQSMNILSDGQNCRINLSV
jgi:hypothetical protein